LRSGETVKRVVVNDAGARKKESLYELDDKIKCVRFVEDSAGVSKIMASCGARIVEMAW